MFLLLGSNDNDPDEGELASPVDVESKLSSASSLLAVPAPTGTGWMEPSEPEDSSDPRESSDPRVSVDVRLSIAGKVEPVSGPELRRGKRREDCRAAKLEVDVTGDRRSDDRWVMDREGERRGRTVKPSEPGEEGSETA